MSALPIITASLAPGFSDGIVLYQSLAQSVNLNDLIRGYYLGEKLPKYADLESDGTINTYTNRIRITAASLPAGLTTPSGYSSNFSELTGTPTTIASTSVLFKIEVFTWNNYIGAGTDFESNVRVGYVSVPINVIAAPTTVTPTPLDPVILTTQLNATQGTYATIALSSGVDTSPAYWSASSLPAGLNISGNNIVGTPTASGSTDVTLTLRYKPDADSGMVTESKIVPFVVAAPAAETPVGNSGVSFLNADGVDMFFNVQSRALSLDVPKAESVIADGSQIVGGSAAKQLIVKPSEILWLNVRVVKGTTIIDPDPTGMRFAVASKVGGPLIMTGETFTKVGSGSSAYFRMRVTSQASEITALLSDYYDADAVEQVSITGDAAGRGDDLVSGFCALELTTGASGTLATLQSDNFPVVIRPSIFS